MQEFLPYAWFEGKCIPFKDAKVSIATHALHYGTAAFGGMRAIPNPANKDEFLLFRREIIIKRTKFELQEAEARVHILEGLNKALQKIEEIIELIKGSKNPEEAKAKLISGYEFSEIQTKAILDMRLQKLTSLETFTQYPFKCCQPIFALSWFN